VEFSPVDQCIATTSGDKTIKLWSLGDYSCLKTFEVRLYCEVEEELEREKSSDIVCNIIGPQQYCFEGCLLNAWNATHLEQL